MTGHITAERIALLVVGPAVPRAAQLAAAIEAHADSYGVNSLLDRAHFMGQACHETDRFRRFEENLHYTSPERLDAMFSAVHGVEDARELISKGPEAIANRVYADRLGNGNEASGDGWRYRGRGMFQLTGRMNYAAAGTGTGLDLLRAPELAADPGGSVTTALWFWKTHGCSVLAARDDVAAVTRVVNGPALDGLDDRRTLTSRGKTIFV